ncbi:DUF368 domain-containing protein [Niallia circulans]|uniref:DUF368 domain-containing protein n=1 Tax=Niallia circulans TaxID=1397 RepID=A0A268FFU9_NIACI|nr:DUF368 domain-containing protein [Niallia circulans]AYV68604.1 DUF368 domain-containing protein [Niallia circulans]AYV73002.1 DUF368 domain-containing protein [Niallia circulans]NRG27864.1 DUF368 domain-containing protein [Niallia circulans]PAD84229.1 DUF368 domain-containing protein [Niallia circulans]QJX64512.1 DUF368 domain-containing protein [Niallia circulans]
MEWKNLYRGFIMGISDLIPGVSGGTIAVILGIYDRLLDAISGFFSRNWKKQLGFLIPLAVGMGAALLLLSRLIEFLLENYHEPTQFFFIGLIIGVIPLMLKEARPKKNFGSGHYIILTIAAIIIASMAFMHPVKSIEPITSLTVWSVLGLFLSGWLASMAMLLPGISGSFILLLLGVYSTAINALSTWNIPVIIVLGLGAIIGFIGSSKGIKYALSHFPHITYAIIIGLIIGSLFVVFPGMVSGATSIILCIITFGLGLSVTTLFGLKK